MQRKLIQQGAGALTLTLPAQWVRDHGLSAKDSVQLDFYESDIRISSTQNKHLTRELDVTDKPRAMTWHYLMGAYIDGVDEIRITHNNPSLILEIQQDFIGTTLTEHTQTHSVITSLISQPNDTLNALLTRVGHMFSQHAQSLVTVCSDSSKQESFERYERLIDAQLLYCMRYINKYERGPQAHQYFLLVATIEHAVDILKDVARHATTKDVSTAKTLATVAETYRMHLANQDFESAYHDLKKTKRALSTQSFIDGLAYQFVETLYNNSEYLLSKRQEPKPQ